MSSHFYAITCTYGPDCIDSDGNRLGTVYVFDSRKDRDKWVAADRWDGSYHRAALTSDEARKCMTSSYLFDWTMLSSRYHIAPDEVSYATMDQIVSCYLSGLTEYEDELALVPSI